MYKGLKESFSKESCYCEGDISDVKEEIPIACEAIVVQSTGF
jgi:hypothetical protein